MPELISSASILILWAVIGYLLGTIPFGLILAKVMHLGNLREIGSGSIGATNVLRTGNKKAAILTLAFDAIKGAIVVLIARHFASEDAAQIAGLAAILGHCFPVWLGFRGGKGVATYFGIMVALAWPVGLAACGVWLVVAYFSRISSLAALVTAGATPLIAIFLDYQPMFLLAIVLYALIYVRHRENLARLRIGTEPKIGEK